VLEVQGTPLMTALEIASALPGVEEAALFGAALHVVVRRDDAPAMVRDALVAAGLTGVAVEPITPSLEDVFVSLVEQTDRELTGVRS
jgi:ABC-2 type transport system ATP-binding protein